ncbi:NAD(P)/FAD-dependent oxidoreductase [Streptomyces longispororuber]|uniref:NAD(P)/FAD-dependent oxidoreductase n=1 Tax=Streptomyces longispororuber TaxID=68230 RepID=UPI002108B2BD|nr:FAD-binding oxidoreductase [Streptomyces longispororuber]MCQ4210957.1 FAD-binding oxidoreductase [Streptomyces longispororuber]
MTRAVVVGAGVLGACVAHHLALAGVHVVVLEEARPAAGTSGATFSADVTHLKTPYAYYRLNRQGSDGHVRLADELDGAPWRHPVPLVQWAADDAARRALRDKASRARGWGHACRLAPPSVLRDLAPAVDPDACAADEVVVHENTAWFDVPRLVDALLASALRHGAEAHDGTPVTGLLRAGGRVTGAVAGERRWPADVVVNCAGPAAARVAGFAGVRLPVRRVPGLVAECGPLAGGPLTAIVAAPGIDLRPTADGGVLALSWEVDARLGGIVGGGVDGLPRELHRRARTVVPALRSAAVADARVGVRPVPLDGLPLVGAVPRAPGLYHLVSHSAVTLAPVLGRLAAREIATGRPVPELAAYRPDRPVPGDVQDENLRAMDRHRPASAPDSRPEV